MSISTSLFAPLLAGSLLLAPALSQAEELSIFGTQTPDGGSTTTRISVGSNDSTILRPLRGQNKQSVTAEFGEPSEIIAAVGEPPISRWVYADYTVYFEYEYVIHSVVHY